VKQGQAPEPGRIEVDRTQQVGRPALRDERPVARGGVDEHPDPGRPRAGGSHGTDQHAVLPERRHERAAGAVTSDGADERRAGPEPGQPAGGIGGGAALGQPNHAPNIGPVAERARGHESHVEREVAENHDPDPSRTGDRLGHQASRIRRGPRGSGAYN
jgi:hypothetical protein